MRFVLLPGQSHNLIGVKPLIQDVEFGMFLGDKAFTQTGCVRNSTIEVR
jgi:hypothetical protein